MQVGGRRHEYQPSSGKSRVGAQFSMWYRVASDFCLYTSKFYWSSSLDVVLAGSSSKTVQGSIFVLSLVAPHIMFIWFTTNEQVRKTSQYCKQKKRNEEYTMKYLKWSTFFVSPSYLWTKDILDGILYKNCLVFPEEQTSRLVKEAKAAGHGRSQKSLGWLWWRWGLPESRGGCSKGWEAGVDIQYMESSSVQDDLQALVQKSVCREWRRWRGEKE